MEKKKVLALVINWNGADDTIELLQSLKKQVSSKIEVHISLIDNHSEEIDFKRLCNNIIKFNDVLPIYLIRNEKNIGVPAGYNQAIAASVEHNYDYYLRLDNDVVLLEGALQNLIEVIERNRKQGARLIGGEMRSYEEPERINGGATKFNLLFGVNSSYNPKSDTVCDGVIGCVMLIDRDVVEEFSPDVFLSWLFITTDESELSLRCSIKGWSTYYVARPLALHKGGRSIKKAGDIPSLYSVRNWAYLTLTYIRPRPLRILVLIRLITMSCFKLMKGKKDMAKWIFKGVVAGLYRRNAGVC